MEVKGGMELLRSTMADDAILMQILGLTLK